MRSVLKHQEIKLAIPGILIFKNNITNIYLIHNSRLKCLICIWPSVQKERGLGPSLLSPSELKARELTPPVLSPSELKAGGLSHQY